MSTSEQDQPVDTMPSRTIFQVLGSAVADACSVRLGRLAFPGRRPIDTPNYTAISSRGAVPHLTPDNVRKYASFGATYMALEDFVEKKEPPILSTPPVHGLPPLHSFTATPPDMVTVLGARRCPPVATPVGNGAEHLSIFTSTGFYSLTTDHFASAVRSLQPDVILPMAELLNTNSKPQSKKLICSVERTEEWLDGFFRHFSPRDLQALGVSVFAPVLPVEYPIQWDYLRHLAEDTIDGLSGLAVYNVDLLADLANYPALTALPRLSLQPPATPHQLLRQISLGIDMCTIPFVNSVSDAGIALNFTFPPPEGISNQPLGVDMSSPEHSTSLEPLQEGCQCYACLSHHRAYLRHLLNAKEMLGWNLLQIHNHQVLSAFFQGIRQTLGRGVSEFEQARRQFQLSYEPEFPQGTGERPRARGYHFKSEAGQAKINKTTWVDLNSASSLPADTSVANGSDSPAQVDDGIETPLKPDGDAQTLAEKGFAERDSR
ncbi:hypothetical protein S7711_07630 [Stachybotrys chartarum IBT 7711]|uniref:Queuine tRNA-ribosyltransferase accessory subunit 2 n=1 Tax=Stachybotrys chartarum (strain CBS 109288 / IBT 7711) TaxID=1280523 RepID=A0A084ALJ4_STACB|nr:hypothetical protein S7711_07630 [Stachybotrys chartarum IBT 7711]